MQKPNNYEQTTVGEYTPPALGGHHLIIKKVEETTSQSGKAMLKIAYDFAKNDVQPEFYMNEFNNDIRPDKKWPHGGMAYILTEDQNGNCSKKFKSFITSFEDSNGVEAVWGEKFAGQFKGKKIGGVYGEVENEYNGKVTMRHELRWFCADDKAMDAAVPAPKYLNKNNQSTQYVNLANGANDLDVNVPSGSDEEIPF